MKDNKFDNSEELLTALTDKIGQYSPMWRFRLLKSTAAERLTLLSFLSSNCAVALNEIFEFL